MDFIFREFLSASEGFLMISKATFQTYGGLNQFPGRS